MGTQKQIKLFGRFQIGQWSLGKRPPAWERRPLQLVPEKLCYEAVVSLGLSLTHFLWFLVLQDSPEAKWQHRPAEPSLLEVLFVFCKAWVSTQYRACLRLPVQDPAQVESSPPQAADRSFGPRERGGSGEASPWSGRGTDLQASHPCRNNLGVPPSS